MATFHDSGSLPYVKHGTTNGLITFNPLTEHVYISVFFMIVYFRTENKKPDIAVPSPLIPFRPLQPLCNTYQVVSTKYVRDQGFKP